MTCQQSWNYGCGGFLAIVILITVVAAVGCSALSPGRDQPIASPTTAEDSEVEGHATGPGVWQWPGFLERWFEGGVDVKLGDPWVLGAVCYAATLIFIGYLYQAKQYRKSLESAHRVIEEALKRRESESD